MVMASVAITNVNAQARLVEKVDKKGSGIIIPYEKYLLPNGLTVIVHEDHSDPVVHVDVTYHVGSSREQIGKSGFAHFFEHMMFMGSENAPEKLHDNITVGAGGTNNGSTNRDRTNYYETVPKNALEPVLWLEADRMGFLLDAVTQEKFEVQRATVKNERGQNYDNRAYGLVFETASKNLYPYGHPYSWSTIGYLEDLDRSDVNDLKNFFLRWYGPNNATLTIGGDVKTAEVIKLVEKYFASIPRGPEVNPVEAAPVKLQSDRYVSYTDNYARLPMLQITYPTVPDYHKDMAALQALAEILGQGKTSVLYQQMVKNQLALQASAFSSLSELAGEFIVRVVPVAGKSLAEMEQLYRASLDTLAARGITDEDVAKFRGKIESGMMNRMQSVAGKVSLLAEFETFTGNPNKISDIIRQYTSVTKDDVMRVFNTYIRNKPAVIQSVLPKGQEALIAKANNYQIDTAGYHAPDYGYTGLQYQRVKDTFDRKVQPSVGKVPQVTAPQYWTGTLPGGIKAIGTHNNEIPLVNITITIPGGHLLQANDLKKAGLASLFAQMMNEDTKNYTAEQFATELQKLGSSISVRSSLDGLVLNVESLKKNLGKTLTLLEERLFRPNFTDAAFNRLKQQALESFKIQKSQPAAIASTVFAKVNYGPRHILGVSQSGTEETVADITLDDIRSYYTKNLGSQGVQVVVAGDVSKQEVLPRLHFLSRLPNKKVVLPKVDPLPMVDKTRIYLIDVPNAAQTEFRIGYATGLKYDATGDFYKSTLTNYPLGAAFTSRFMQYLRETKGWTYGIRSGFSGDRHAGDFSISSGIRANATDSALVAIMNELHDYATKGPRADEVEFLKKAVGQSEARRYETLDQKASFIGRILEYNLQPGFTQKQQEILQKLSADDIKTMAAKYMNPGKMNILLVADKKRVYDSLKALGYEIIELDADGNLAEKKVM